MKLLKIILISISSWIKFCKEFYALQGILAGNRFICLWKDRWPCFNDATGTTGFDAHYVYHTAWATRMLRVINPGRHVDIGSCLRFVTIVSAFIPVYFYDFRPAKLNLPEFQALHGDICALPFEDGTIPSLSCMHVIEHIGLGRYGDTFDPQGDLKAIRELKRILAKGGDLLFVVPVGGIARIQYNAHRIYTYDQIKELFFDYTLIDFALVTDTGEFISNANSIISNQQRYGCGCFHFRKPA